MVACAAQFSRKPHRWWSATAAFLALMLALVLAVPDCGLADDLRSPKAASVMAAVTGLSPDTPDQGLSCHIHCSCHPAACLTMGVALMVPGLVRIAFVTVAEAGSSVAPEHRRKPPRG